MEFVERFIDADGERLRILEAGTGAPLIVLADAMAGEPGLAETILAESLRVIVIGVPAGAPQRVSATLASAIGSFEAAPAALLASSLATPLALWLAIERVQQIRTIVLESPLAFSPHAATLGARSDVDWRLAFNIHPERKSTITAPAASTLAALAQDRLTPAQDDIFAKNLAAFDAPVLALFGTRDPLAPVELGRFYKTLFPNAYCLMVYDAAHDIRGDRPEAFAEAVGDFLRRGAQFTVGERSARLHR
jgi:pimeloyl-ACP methyl ester carboxylesterase